LTLFHSGIKLAGVCVCAQYDSHFYKFLQCAECIENFLKCVTYLQVYSFTGNSCCVLLFSWFCVVHNTDIQTSSAYEK